MKTISELKLLIKDGMKRVLSASMRDLFFPGDIIQPYSLDPYLFSVIKLKVQLS